jgi:hypothetical protein
MWRPQQRSKTFQQAIMGSFYHKPKQKTIYARQNYAIFFMEGQNGALAQPARFHFGATIASRT